MEKVKLYSYADETGIETSGRFFLVAVILIEQSRAGEVEKDLEAIEKKTKKNLVKWSRSSLAVKKRFIGEVAKLEYLKNTVFYREFSDSKRYLYMIAVTIAEAIKARNDTNYAVKVIVDGLNDKDVEKLRKYLKQLKVKYDTIRGMKDEQTAFLRLADSMAGFARDYIEDQSYTQRLFTLLREKSISDSSEGEPKGTGRQRQRRKPGKADHGD